MMGEFNRMFLTIIGIVVMSVIMIGFSKLMGFENTVLFGISVIIIKGIWDGQKE